MPNTEGLHVSSCKCWWVCSSRQILYVWSQYQEFNTCLAKLQRVSSEPRKYSKKRLAHGVMQTNHTFDIRVMWALEVHHYETYIFITAHICYQIPGSVWCCNLTSIEMLLKRGIVNISTPGQITLASALLCLIFNSWEILSVALQFTVSTANWQKIGSLMEVQAVRREMKVGK